MSQNITNKLKSEGERSIAAALDHYGLTFTYEPKLPIHDGRRRRVLRPDFYLPNQNVYIEYFGRAGNDSYDRRSTEKMHLYEANGHSVVPLYPWDLCKDWPGGLLDRIDQAERHAARRRPAYASRAPMTYRSPNQVCGYGTNGNAAYRR